MTNEEALYMLTQHQAWARSASKRYAEAVNAAIKALEKQISKKVRRVKLRDSEHGSSYRCGNCGADLIKVEFMSFDGRVPKDRTSYCWHCGQVIDWSEEE